MKWATVERIGIDFPVIFRTPHVHTHTHTQWVSPDQVNGCIALKTITSDDASLEIMLFHNICALITLQPKVRQKNNHYNFVVVVVFAAAMFGNSISIDIAGVTMG